MEKEVIKIENLCKRYSLGSETVNALDSINLSVSKGEFVAIMGSSGSGKSTLMNILGCLDSPTSGSYCLNGLDVFGTNDDDLADIRNREIGFIFQTFNLLSRYNAIKNVALPLIYSGVSVDKREEMAIKALENVGLGSRLEHKPMEMSGGQRQRVAIARALVNSPSLILADEPTGNLDTKTSNEIMELLTSLNRKGNTIVVVTHEDEISNYAKRVIYLKDGRIYREKFNK
ncbi:MAG: macrolide ABC transporter ATP-binding protein [Candidatus Cloacimonadota bacterium]|nr:MAG: macrolide ABC transporter ATP-binding protein [Candidatus Cloacimonadota bacterium]PIE81765.1 MAG: macrolide ABC transporter ATP-binding protein [Candidatus Delongbacteria bacterium]